MYICMWVCIYTDFPNLSHWKRKKFKSRRVAWQTGGDAAWYFQGVHPAHGSFNTPVALRKADSLLIINKVISWMWSKRGWILVFLEGHWDITQGLHSTSQPGWHQCLLPLGRWLAFSRTQSYFKVISFPPGFKYLYQHSPKEMTPEDSGGKGTACTPRAAHRWRVDAWAWSSPAHPKTNWVLSSPCNKPMQLFSPYSLSPIITNFFLTS